VANKAEYKPSDHFFQMSGALNIRGLRPRRHGMAYKDVLRLPVVALSAEYLTIGYLMRRNILAYKAPPQNEGYDLICIHPDPKRVTKQIRVQVKSRYQTDCDRSVPVKEKSFSAFDYLIVVFLNIGYYYRGKRTEDGYKEPEFYTLPADFVRDHYKEVASGFNKLRTKNVDLSLYHDQTGFEMIARDLDIAYPCRETGEILPNQLTEEEAC
jgi:hypothetical protein